MIVRGVLSETGETNEFKYTWGEISCGPHEHVGPGLNVHTSIKVYLKLRVMDSKPFSPFFGSNSCTAAVTIS